MATSLHFARLRKWLLSSPPAEWGIQQLRQLLLGALKQGAVPEHIAFVMDGNRRFARNNHIETIEGHNLGFEALARILEVCYKCGVKVVTIYAFSIENFKRSKYEVGALMDMAKVKLSQLAQHGELLQRYGAKLQFLGQREMIRPDVLETIDKAIALTSGNGKAILNVCAPYTSRDEITTAIRTTVIDYSKPVMPPLTRPFSETHITRNIRAQHLSPVSEEQEAIPSKSNGETNKPQQDIPEIKLDHHSATDPDTNAYTSASSSPATGSTTLPQPSTPPPSQEVLNFPDPERITASTITSHMFTADAPPLDLLIRTSGVERLSDFMLWQCHENTDIVFLDCLWPEFDLWKFLPVLVEWQWRKQREEKGESERGWKWTTKGKIA
ncbi:Undecaprenyl diphosphate synthase [Aulographum hederae CBS 113979]|uniref:Alkyl transferase n=1 Tax=Aulographum hederae CBS 113979 TaxID=1176131 RepID=A0A6G1GTW7_9PEZI|nr:Undecaprenyl diphosphate synthase [Aulographum hederae CBS 113979]